MFSIMSSNFDLSWFNSSLLPFLLFLSFLLAIIKRANTKNPKLPPSPPKLPFIGNLHQLRNPVLHHSFHSLSKKYGPLMLVQLGQIPTLVVSSPHYAEQIMKTHDAIFASRPYKKASDVILDGVQDLAFAPCGEHWKQLRKLCVTHLLNARMVQSFQRVREEEVSFMIEEVSAACLSSSGRPIDMTTILNLFANMVFCRAILGKSYRGEGTVNNVFCELTHKDVVLVGKFSFEDCFPTLRWLDKLTGLEAMAERANRGWHALLDEVIAERLEMIKQEGGARENRDFVDVLLDIEKDPDADFPVNRVLTKIILLDMIGASTDASFIVLEWGLAELIRNPWVLKKLKDEVRGRTNKGTTVIREADLGELNYLRATIKEILRMHPSVPLLLPRESMEACTLDGYEIPNKTRVIINAWAIGRDPGAWDAPDEFRPERFLSSSVDLFGHDFQVIPFGAGRRVCPGAQFAVTTLELALANLVLRFDWKLPPGMRAEDMDMNESPGLTTRRKEKLQLVVEPAVVT